MGTTNVQSGFNANDLYIDKTNHRIGMGTGSPEKELHVNGDIMFPNNKAIYSKDLAGTVVKIIEFTSGDVLNFGTAATVDGFIFNAGGTANALVIDSSGDVGIGTDSPSAKLEIHNDDDANQNTLDCYNDNGYITFSVDPKSDGTGRLRLFDGTAGGTHVFEVDAGGKMYFTGGNVGIGTDSPGGNLEISDPVESNLILMSDNNNDHASTDAVIRFKENGNATTLASVRYDEGNDTLSMGRASGSDVNIDSSGNVGIGTDSPDEKLEVYAASAPVEIRSRSDSLASGEDAAVRCVGYGAAGSPAVGILGSVYYNQSSNGGSDNAVGFLALEAGDGQYNYLWADNSDNLRISTTDTHRGSTNGTVVGDQTSDERLKNIVGNCDYGLDEILALDTIAFNFKDDKTAEKHIGFSAQKTQPIIPEAVYSTGEKIDDTGAPKLAMRYHEIIPVLVNAIKEQQKQINELKEMIK